MAQYGSGKYGTDVYGTGGGGGGFGASGKDTTYSLDGVGSMKVVSDGSSSNAFMFASTAIASSQPYLASAYLFAPPGNLPGTANGTKGASLEVIRKNSGGTQVGTTEISLNDHVTNGWQRLLVGFTSESTAATAEVRLHNYDNGTIWFDDISFIQTVQNAYETTYIEGAQGTGYSYAGRRNKAVSARADSSYAVDVTNILSDNNLSILFWGRPEWASDEKPANLQYHLVSLTNNTNGTGYFLRTSSVASFNWRVLGGTTSSPSPSIDVSDSTVDTHEEDDLIFMAATISSSRVMTGYAKIGFNGILRSATSGTAAASFTPANLNIGKRTQEFWDGVVERVYVFDRVLSSSEIAEYAALDTWTDTPSDAIIVLDFEDPTALVRTVDVITPTTGKDTLSLSESYLIKKARWSKVIQK